MKAYAEANPEKVRKLHREKRRRPKYRKMDRQWVKDYPERAKAIKDRWAAKNRDKRKAEWTVRNAVRDGRMVKPKRCQGCGKRKKLEAHHPDYSKPLEVQWLCTPCHGETRHKS